MHEAPLDDNYYPDTRQGEAMVERISEIEHLMNAAQSEIDHFEQEIMAIDDNIKKLKSTFKKWDIEHEADESVAKLNIAKEEYRYIIDGWDIELEELKSEKRRMEGIL